MAKKLALFLLVFFALLQSAVHAQDQISINYNILSDQIPPNGAAKFEMFITNNQEFQDEFFIEVPDVAWSVQTWPLTHFTNGFSIGTSGQERFVIAVAPPRTIAFGKHNVQVDFISRITGKRYSTFFEIDVREDLIIYPLEIDSAINMPSTVDPRNPISIKINLKNNQPVSLKDIVVKVQSRYFSKDVTTDLGRDAEKTLDLEFNIDPMTPPQKDTVTAVVLSNGTQASSSKQDYEIVSYLPPFTLKTNTVKDVLVYTDIITITNDGNVEKEQEVQVPKLFLDSIFSVPNPTSYNTKLGGKNFYTWKVRLSPGQSTAVTINRNYWSALLSALVIIAAYILYLLFRNPIVIEKEARKVYRHGESLTGIKVMLRIKNRSLKPIHNVRLTDRIPAVAVFLKETGDTARPSRIVHHGTETLVGWDLAEVTSRGERIVTYEIKAKLGIVGGIDLHPVTAKFRMHNGKEKTATSNSLDIFL